MSKKWLMSLSVAASIAVLTACGSTSGETGESAPPSQQQEAPSSEAGQAPEPDLKDIPDVVATVNGKDVNKEKFTQAYKAQFQQAAMQAQMSGQELDQAKLKKQTAEVLAGNELMLQEAQKRNLTASDADVEKKLQELMSQNDFGSADELFAALEAQGLDEKQARAELKSQTSLERLLEDEAGSMEPTEQELKSAYEKVVAQQGKAAEGQEAEVPSFEELKDNLAQQVKAQKQGQAAQSLVEKLKKDADIDILV